jgi:hypothetical protein
MLSAFGRRPFSDIWPAHETDWLRRVRMQAMLAAALKTPEQSARRIPFGAPASAEPQRGLRGVQVRDIVPLQI